MLGSADSCPESDSRADEAAVGHKLARIELGPAYALLGVASNATARQIRAAYLALIKQSHPDIAGATRAKPSATDANRAYWHLSNPARRAAYDRSLLTAVPVALRSSRALVLAAPDRARVRWGRVLFAICAAATITVVTIYGRARDGAPPAVAAVDPIKLRPGQRQTIDDRSAIVSEAQLNFEWMALQTDELAVARFSAACWTSLQDGASESLLDYCLAFDSAARRAYGAAAHYFDISAIVDRARTAARQFGQDEPLAARIRYIDAVIAANLHTGLLRHRAERNWLPVLPTGLRPSGGERIR